jgi:hypothetical protein
MGLLWRLFAPRGLKKARRALHPSWILEDAIVRSARKRRRQRRPHSQTRSRRASLAFYGAELSDTDTGRTWRCTHDHTTQQAASRCADVMEERINRLGWEQATRDSL